jgi:hypothetical protein
LFTHETLGDPDRRSLETRTDVGDPDRRLFRERDPDRRLFRETRTDGCSERDQRSQRPGPTVVQRETRTEERPGPTVVPEETRTDGSRGRPDRRLLDTLTGRPRRDPDRRLFRRRPRETGPTVIRARHPDRRLYTHETLGDPDRRSLETRTDGCFRERPGPTVVPETRTRETRTDGCSERRSGGRRPGPTVVPEETQRDPDRRLFREEERREETRPGPTVVPRGGETRTDGCSGGDPDRRFRRDPDRRLFRRRPRETGPTVIRARDPERETRTDGCSGGERDPGPRDQRPRERPGPTVVPEVRETPDRETRTDGCSGGGHPEPMVIDADGSFAGDRTDGYSRERP